MTMPESGTGALWDSHVADIGPEVRDFFIVCCFGDDGHRRHRTAAGQYPDRGASGMPRPVNLEVGIAVALADCHTQSTVDMA
jgi:hypothetical protein